jgi:drug/metabolite transporter (DMT)-like permease
VDIQKFLPSIKLSSHFVAVWQALFVTFLWSTSWVLIKFGLADIPALTFAGLRYTIAFACLLPFTVNRASLVGLGRLSKSDWLQLVFLGVLFYSVTQGAQFLALAYLPAVTTTLLLNFTTIIVALIGIVLLAERPIPRQWAGIGLNLTGIMLYFYPVDLPAGQLFGISVAMVGVLANAGSAILGRHINRAAKISPVQVTTISMGVGASLLLVTGVAIQGLPALSLSNWAIILWLAVVNTALAFSLWNLTLRELSAVESSIINSTMLIQIAILAWIFLDEQISWQAGAGLLLAGAGVLLVQLRRSPATDLPPGKNRSHC